MKSNRFAPAMVSLLFTLALLSGFSEVAVAQSGKADSSNGVSNLKPYTPPQMAPGFPGQGDANDWKKATKFFNLGIDASGAGKFPEAIKLYNQAIGIYPYDFIYYANLGYALERNSKPAEGVIACKKAIQLQKDFGGAWENLGNCEYDLGHYKESRDAFNHALKCELTVRKRDELIKVVQKLTEQIDKSK
jgi:tetratricopeptide (TPR) repeat protein